MSLQPNILAKHYRTLKKLANKTPSVLKVISGFCEILNGKLAADGALEYMELNTENWQKRVSLSH